MSSATLDPKTVDAWVVELGQRRDYFRRLGIAYQTLVVPGEITPAGSLFDQLSEALDDEIRAQCVQPVDELVDGPDRRAWIGYRASVSALVASEPRTRVLDDAAVEWSERPGSDGRATPAATVRAPRSRLVVSVSTEDDDTYLVVEQDAPDLPAAVVFRDSLMDAAAKFFAESFRRVVFVSSPNVIHRDLVESERPDVVIHALAEDRLVIAPGPSTADFRTVFGDLLLDDGEARADQRRSRSLARAGRIEEALAASDDVLARVAPTARLLLHRARLHLESGDVGAALEAVRHAATLDPDDGSVWALLGQLFGQTPGRERERAPALARAARAEPGRVGFWQQAIAAALGADELRLAEELRREALTSHADDPQLAHAASWVLAATGHLEEAEEAAGYAARAEPGTIEHLWQLASIQIRRGNVEDAVDTMHRLSLLRPDDPDVQHYREVLRQAMAARDQASAGVGTSTVGGSDQGQR